MNWVEIAWTMMAAASITLGFIHLLVWSRHRSDYAHLAFFVLATSVAAFSAFELLMMQARTPAAYAAVLRWGHVPLCAIVLSIVWFVRFYFDAGRLWLAYAVTVFRLLSLLLNFVTGVNINFQDVTALSLAALWGGAVVAVPIGILNPWQVVAQIANLLLVAFVIDASITLWRRGGPVARRRAVLVGGSILLCVVIAVSLGVMVLAGAVHASTMVTPGFLIVVLAMGYELSWDVIAAAQLAAKLRASELSLRSSEEQFRAVVETVPNAILLVEDQGKVMLSNPQAHALFGYTREELIGRPVELLIPARYRSSHETYRQSYAVDARARAMGFARELYALHKDGSEVPVEVVLKPMRIADELLVLVSLVDVTERRRNERTAAKQRDEIAHLSRVAMLGELSGSLAHELNQPLTAILSNAQAAQRLLARNPPQLDNLSEILADIVKNDRRAGAVIQQLRSLIKKEDVERQALNVNDAVQESLRLIHSDLLSRQVTVGTELAEKLPPVIGDRVQLQQVLLNLLINGCDAMDGREADRHLVVSSRATASGSVEISVTDEGTGIPPQDLERIFEPFVTTKAHGMGLGLSICRSIAETCGGHLWATNNAERGATLHFELPGQAD